MTKGRLVVVGGGPAGIEAAITASGHFDKVLLISEQPAGAWKMNDLSVWQHQVWRSPHLSPQDINTSAKNVHVNWMSTQIDLLHKKGVSTMMGRVQFISANKISVDSGEKQTEVEGDYFLLAVGSRPAYPEFLHPIKDKVLTFHTLHELKEFPKDVAIIGDGPVGFEAVNLFSMAGTHVKWVVPGDGPSARLFDADLSTYLVDEYKTRGVSVYNGGKAKQVEETTSGVKVHTDQDEVILADKVFMIPTFVTNIDQLHIEKAGVSRESISSIYGETNQPHIYIAGDAELSISAVYAQAKARAAVLHMKGSQEVPVSMEEIPLSFHFAPEVASVGLTETNQTGLQTKLIALGERSYVTFLKGNQKTEFVKVIYNDQGILFGASAVGEGAKEIISLLSIPIKLKQSVQNLQTFFATHPSHNEAAAYIIREIADETS